MHPLIAADGPVEHSHCHRCGSPYGPQSFPKTCPGCGHEEHDNPTPVANLLQEVADDDRRGVLLIVRGTQPFLGGLALPGGFIERWLDHSAPAAARREFGEELGFEAPEGAVPFHSAATVNGNLIEFARSTAPIPASALTGWRPTAEAQAVVVAYEPMRLCFETHTEALALWMRSFARA